MSITTNKCTVACENIHFSSPFAAGDVSPRETSQRRRAMRNGCFRRQNAPKQKSKQNCRRSPMHSLLSLRCHGHPPGGNQGYLFYKASNRSRRKKSNFAGFSETNSLKIQPISRNFLRNFQGKLH